MWMELAANRSRTAAARVASPRYVPQAESLMFEVIAVADQRETPIHLGWGVYDQPLLFSLCFLFPCRLPPKSVVMELTAAARGLAAGTVPRGSCRVDKHLSTLQR